MEPTLCPFTIVRDSNEDDTWGFKFQNFFTQAKSPKDPLIVTHRTVGRPVEVPIVEKAMWSMGRAEYGAGLADYSIEGMEEEIQIEMKHSVEDLYASVTQRRANFEAEIASLNERCKYAAVIITTNWDAIRRGIKLSKVRPQSVINTMLRWEQKYPGVHWKVVPRREWAEEMCFQILELYHRKTRGAGGNGKGIQ